MVRIRLRRVGAKNQASFRIVVTDSRSPRDGRFIEKIGFYNPRTEPQTIELDEARALHWLQHGAQPSDSVQRLLKNVGTLERFERLRSGEPLENLLAEAEAAAAARPPVDPRTRRDDIKPAGKKKAAAQPAPQAEETAKTVTEAEAKAEESPEAESIAEETAETESAAEETAETESAAEETAETEETPEAEAE